MQFWILKVMTLCAELTMTLIAGLLPVKLANWIQTSSPKTAETAMTLCGCFAGGVFLGTTFLHLMPSAREALEKAYVLTKTSSQFPVPEILVCSGFFLILVIEQLVSSCQRTSPKASGSVSVSKGEADDTMDLTMLLPAKDGRGNYQALQKKPSQVRVSLHIRSFVMFIALSVHSFFGGLPVGLMKTEAEVFNIFIAISVHKVVVAFSLGMTLMKAGQQRKIVVRAMILFSVITPCGIAIGIVVYHAGGHSHPAALITNATLQGLATGTFLYATFFEVLFTEFTKHGAEISKLVTVFIGFLFTFAMVILEIYV